MLSVFAANGIDRIFEVPGESYIGVLDALSDFPQIDVVTCRHESGAGFMACADGRLTRRPGVLMVSRGPGASNASIAVHTAQQDAIPLILIIGQIPKKDLRREAFQEIDYHKMFGSIAKWVAEPTDPAQLGEMAFKAIRMATSGTPGPVVLVIPEDIQQQRTPQPNWVARPNAPTTATPAVIAELRALLERAERPLIVAGGAFDKPQGREILLAFAEAWNIPVAVAFRRHDVFPNTHPLFIGDLGLSNPEKQMSVLHSSDLILALGTRLDDITSQGYSFPQLPKPAQTFVHCYPDDHIVGLHFAPDFGLVCDPVALAADLTPPEPPRTTEARGQWSRKLRGIFEDIAAWPTREADDGVSFAHVVRALANQAPKHAMICLDAGTFAAPVYRHFPFVYPQRLMAPLSGAMGYGTPAAIAAQLRHPEAKVICMVGDGGFMMTGNEMIAAVERKLPILFILSNNNCYASIRIHQEINYPGRHVGTALFNPDFIRIAEGFGMQSEAVIESGQIDAAIARGLAAKGPYFIEVRTSLKVILPPRGD
ncbi:MAG: thiamine pyrophosphate enzyme central domain protein [Herminiimonas sp.]|nr:thiamine pyrophosphate enzyme central domain protein [Herminiimonas sp.]